ncbi:MAG TPA: isochorismate synthase [Chlamydiales bacterium]|jgi:menaquinone-specific isochorismate synthase|nr:isochorismate synthase [Chlamydiales bacterium]
MHGKIFWRSKDGTSAPSNAQFSLWPFTGTQQTLENVSVISKLPFPIPPVPILRRIHNPDRDSWMQLVQQAVLQIKKGALQKVVLARETTLYLDYAPDPFQMTAMLDKKSEGATLFCLQFDQKKAFFGATPERLFRAQGPEIRVEAVAGTRRRGKTEAECAQLEQELLSSAKDLHEFRFVQDYFANHLPSIQFSPHRVHRTANVQHLYSEGISPLCPTQNPLDLVPLLHPTPALAGTPKQKALAWIKAQEPFERGLYGGIIGWQNPLQSEWVVAIRSCLLEGSVAKLYTGTGIVADSDPALEWEELEAKIALYNHLFAGNS